MLIKVFVVLESYTNNNVIIINGKEIKDKK